MTQRPVRLVLDSVPRETSREPLVALLRRYTGSDHKQDLNQLLETCPAPLRKRMSERRGIQLVTALRNLGVRAHLEPYPNAAPAAPTRSKKPLTDNSGQPQPADPAAGRPTGSQGLRTALLLTLLLLISAYALLFSPIAPWPLLAGDPPSHSPAKSHHPMDAREMPPSLLDSPLRDKRLAGALVEAARLRLALSGSDPSVPTAIDYRIEDGPGDHYRISYDVAGDSHALTLSSRPEATGANLQALAELLDRITPETPASGGAPTQTALSIPLSSRDLLTGLAELERELGQGDDAGVLLKAAELYAWQGFFKTVLVDSRVADLHATRALACYLAAGSSDPFVEALVLLALDLPAAGLGALESLSGQAASGQSPSGQSPSGQSPSGQSGTDQPRAQLLTAFLKRDIAALRRAHGEANIDQHRLTGYLLARAARESRLGAEATRLLLEVTANYPDFTALQEYAAEVYVAGVGDPFESGYALDLLELHLETLGRLADRDALQGDQELDLAARRQTTTEQALDKWVGLHARLLARPLRLHNSGYLFDSALLKRLLTLEMQDALFYAFSYELRKHFRLQRGERLAKLIETTYPDSPLSQTARLWVNAINIRDPDANHKYRLGVDLSGADRRLIDSYLEIAVRDDKATGFPKIFDTLERMRTLSNPSLGDTAGLAHTLHRARLRPPALLHLRNAMEIAPYDFRIARFAHELKLPSSELDRYLQGLEHLPPVLYLRGAEAQRKGNKDIAGDYFRQAIAASPGDVKAYNELAQILLDQGEKEQAVATWKAYLEHDVGSSDAIDVLKRLGRLALDAEEFDEAYRLFEKAARGRGAQSLLGLAYASEKTDRILQAEKLFKGLAESFPQGEWPAELANFYLRQGNRETALKVLRTYLRFNTSSYYANRLARQAHKEDRPEQAIAIAREVSPKHWKGIRIRYFLAKTLFELGRNELAAELYGSLARDIAKPRQSAPYTYAPYYLQASEAARPGSTATVLQELLDLYADIHPTVMEYFGVHLLMEDMHALAVPVFIQRVGMTAHRADVSLLMAALSWRRSGVGQETDKARILELLQGFDDAWLATRVRFLVEEIGQEELMQQAQGRSRLCQAHYFLGAIAASRGERELAEKHLVASLQTRAVRYMEYQYAYDLLEKLDS